MMVTFFNANCRWYKKTGQNFSMHNVGSIIGTVKCQLNSKADFEVSNEPKNKQKYFSFCAQAS